MGPRGAPEELRFDFGDALDEPGSPAGPAGRHPGAEGEDAASALRRRVDEVVAIAHAKGRRAQHPAQGFLASEPAERPGEASHPGLAREGSGPQREEAAEEEAGEEPEEPPAHDGRSSDGAFRIADFYERLRQVISRGFPGEWWVTGEIRGFRESRGHRYLELVDEGADPHGKAPAQQLEVACWARDWPPVASALAEAGVSLEVGRVVRVRGRVSVWEGGSKLRFTMTALDVEALLGGIAAARHRLLQALAAEDLLEANLRLGVPLVPLRVGVVTSPGSEAHRDFVGQLDRSGYAFEVLLEPSLVQGPEAPFQLAAALGRLAHREPDLVVVVRGGGARGDLAAFDSEQVARAIATAPFPVWTGVGHTGDHSVADEVAQRACITPTACGQAVVALVDTYVEQVRSRAARLSSLARARLEGAAARVETTRGALSRGVRHQLERRRDVLAVTGDRCRRAVEARLAAASAGVERNASALAGATSRSLARDEREVHRCQQVLRAYDPRRQLERGWSLTRDGSGCLVRSSGQLAPGAELRTRLQDGEVRSVVSAAAERGPADKRSRVERSAGD